MLLLFLYDMDNLITEFNQFENTINDDKFVFYHGGNLDSYTDFINMKKGRYEFGPGLYLTNHYSTAAQYAKGSRKLYKVTVEKGLDINDAYFNSKDIQYLLDVFIPSSMKKEIKARLERYIKDDGSIKASIVNNNILNSGKLTPKKATELQKFLVKKGIDYEMMDNSFGWGEKIMVLYNTRKIDTIERVNPKDDIIEFL